MLFLQKKVTRAIRENKNLLFTLLLLIALLPYLYLSIYANPAADDFGYAFRGKSFDFFHTLKNEYFHWNGRYASNLLVLMNPLAYNSFFWYKISPILILLSTLFSFLLFIKTLTINILKKSEVFQIGLLLTLMYVYQMPSISEGIYWYTGAVTYQVGIILMLIYLSLLLLIFRNKFLLKSTIFNTLLLVVLQFLIIGFNEVLMLAMLCFASISLVISFKANLENKKLFIILFVATLAFSLLVLFAPGNKIREISFPNNHQLFPSLMYSVVQTFRFSLNWMSSIPLLFLSVLYFFLNKNLSKNIRLFSVSFYLTPLVSGLLIFFTVFICIFPAYWSTATLGQYRTLNVAYFLFIILWFVNLTVCFNFYKNSLNFITELHSSLKIVIIIFVWVSFIFTKNGYESMTDIFYGKAVNFEKQMKARYAIMLDAHKLKSDTIFFKPILDPPRCLFVLDITDYPSHWLNEGYTLYYNQRDKKILKAKY